MVFPDHQFERLGGPAVVECHGLLCRDVGGIHKALLKLYQSHNAVIDQSHKLRTYALAHERLFLHLKTAYALGFDEQLVGE